MQGIYWAGPLTNVYTSAQVSDFTKTVKRRFPEIEVWISCVETASQTEGPQVPPEVDGIVITEVNDASAEAVRNKTDDILPKWREKAGNRSLILNWVAYSGPQGGLVPRSQLGTFRACVAAAKKHGLAGVLFNHYGENKSRGSAGIHTRPELVEEVKKCGEELGFHRKR